MKNMETTEDKDSAENSLCMIYVPFPSSAAALAVSEKMIEEKLAACSNIVGPAISLYVYQGRTCREEEFIAYFKTRRALFAAFEKRLTELHPYDCPCIAMLPVEASNLAYRQWVLLQTNQNIQTHPSHQKLTKEIP
jgi:periplasmic divalent cation tolerance protein